MEPQQRRLTRYHWLPAPADRPGFYVYVRDRAGGELWNPHFAPTCRPLDAFECRHGLGYWAAKTGVLQVRTGEPHFDRVVNTWGPLNAQVTLERTRDISTDHMGVDGMRFRDTMQDALAVASFDPDFARERIRLVLASQSKTGAGNFAFYAFNSTVIGPAQGKDFGRGGISWLTGTASWMYIAATQYILGIRPTLAGLTVQPCLPSAWPPVRVMRRFRGRRYRVTVRNAPERSEIQELSVDGR